MELESSDKDTDIKCGSDEVTLNKEKNLLSFVRNKTTGNYSVYSSEGGRINLQLLGVYIPFGLEKYNDSEIVNFQIESNNNYHYNAILRIKEIDKAFRDLQNKNLDIDLTGLEYYPIITKTEYEKNTNNKTKTNKNKTIKTKKNETKSEKYIIRSYLKNGVKITHSQLFGTYDKTKLRSKKCDIEIELGSLWSNDKKYGCTIYVSSIKIIN